ncbi:metallophosphoesterase [Spirosoma fluminis]
MKLVTISDIHGRSDWVHVDVASYDRVIFLGDYVDSHSINDGVILNNLQQIIQLKQRYAEKVVLLIGNHDAQYMHYPNYSCSGFRQSMQRELTTLFTENRSLFQIAYQARNYLFTHAGVTNNWLTACKRRLRKSTIGSALDDTAALANGLNRMYTTSATQPILFEVAPARGGDDPFSGPVWADRSETRRDYLREFHQIVGHTPTQEFITVGDETSSITYADILEYERAFYEVQIPD